MVRFLGRLGTLFSLRKMEGRAAGGSSSMLRFSRISVIPLQVTLFKFKLTNTLSELTAKTYQKPIAKEKKKIETRALF